VGTHVGEKEIHCQEEGKNRKSEGKEDCAFRKEELEKSVQSTLLLRPRQRPPRLSLSKRKARARGGETKTRQWGKKKENMKESGTSTGLFAKRNVIIEWGICGICANRGQRRGGEWEAGSAARRKKKRRRKKRGRLSTSEDQITWRETPTSPVRCEGRGGKERERQGHHYSGKTTKGNSQGGGVV